LVRRNYRASDTTDGVVTMSNNQRGLQPPHPRTEEAFLSELQDRIERDRQFIAQGEELLARWKVTINRIKDRLREVLSRQRGGD
jgi:hypothetical protein